MIRYLLLLFFSLLLLGLNLEEDSELIKEQKLIIAELSGHKAFENGAFLSSRSTSEERLRASNYLRSKISFLGIKPKIQNYTFPNVNPLVDLLINPFKGRNVYAVLRSHQASDEYVVLGAHFDTERNCPGAIDNATGVAIGFGVIQKLINLKDRKRNVILVFFDQEEEDLIGSQAFAQMLKKREYNIHSVHTLDAMGWDRDGDQAVELECPTNYLEKLYNAKGKELGIPVYTTNVNSTDHHSFRELGFKATGLTDELKNGDYAPYKDTPKDTYNTVNFDYVTSSTKLIYEVFKEIIQE